MSTLPSLPYGRSNTIPYVYIDKKMRIKRLKNEKKITHATLSDKHGNIAVSMAIFYTYKK